VIYELDAMSEFLSALMDLLVDIQNEEQNTTANEIGKKDM